MAAKVFFSYTHKDEALRDQLANHLAIMKRQGVIETWHDRQIDAGQELDPVIKEALESADIILCLASPDFFASNYCYDIEMGRALERRRAGECEVIPVILRPCDWKHSPLAALRVTPRDGKAVTTFANPDEALQDITQDIRRAARELEDCRKLAAPAVVSQSAAARPVPVAAQARAQTRPRIRRTFKDADKDAFLEAAFETISDFVKEAVDGLRTEAPHIEARFKHIDARSFSVSIYEDGRRAAAGSIWYGERHLFRGVP